MQVISEEEARAVEWTGQVYADAPTVSVSTYIDAPVEDVWALVSDIHLMPRLSSELQEVEWLDGATAPQPGSRFVGRSTHPELGDWETISTVVDCAAPRCFSWAVGDPGRPSSVWRFTLVRQDSGTVLEQWAQMGPAPSGLTFAIDAMPEKEQKIVFVRLREFEAGMKANLAALKDLAEQEK
ncbi:SRPBCC family protein [Streptomyces sp. NPDC046727]|uniref:SRPBCC family protein n=1 Tax=Streptomyces sp. NPDC046727 TaxID=3155373 RepID=UPI0034113D21